MSSEESIEDQVEYEKQSELLFLALQLQEFPEAMEKSQVPEAKRKKDVALQTLVKRYEKNFGKVSSVKSVLKKINNMKTRLKKKADKKETGNRPIILNRWEKILFEVLEGESNPTMTRIPGALSAGINYDVAEENNGQSQKRRRSMSPPHTVVRNSKTPGEETPTQGNSVASSVAHQNSLKKNKNQYMEKLENEETRKLSNAELQRLVLLEQLNTARAQRAAAQAQEAFYVSQVSQRSEISMRRSETDINIFPDYLNL